MDKRRKNNIQWFKTGFVLLFNLVIVFNLSINSLHDLGSHQHSSEEVCNQEFEKDACHRYLVHHEESTNCNKTHKHFSEKTEDCFVCKYFKQRQTDSFYDHSIDSFYSVFVNSEYHHYSFIFTSQNIDCLYLRGPPVYTL